VVVELEAKLERRPWDRRRYGKWFDQEWDRCLGGGDGRTPNGRVSSTLNLDLRY